MRRDLQQMTIPGIDTTPIQHRDNAAGIPERILNHRWFRWVGALGMAWLLCGAGVVQAQDDDGWNVRNRNRRQQVVMRRFQAIVEAQPKRNFAYRRMIQMARRSPGLDKLIEEYRRKVKKYPAKQNYRLIYAHLLNTTRQQAKALLQYLEVVRRAPRFTLGHLYVAEIYQSLQQHQKALLSYQQAFKLTKKKPIQSRCLKAMGTLSLQLKKPQQALKYWQQFLALSPNNMRAREELALAMANQRMYKEALAQWKAVMQRSRGSAQRSRIMRKMGNLYELWGKWQKAIALYRKAMGFTQRGHWVRRELNERVLQLHRENGKLADLANYLKLQKKKGAAELAMLARLLDELGRDKEAAGAYDKALRANPRDGKLRQKYITLLEVLNRIPPAIQQYKELIRREPTEPRHRLSYAEMLSRVGKRKESMAAMRALAKTFSRNTEILNRLANLYRRRRMTKEALLLYNRLIRVEPQEPAHRRALGQYYYQMGEYKKAEATWSSILRSGMTRHIAYSALGQIFRDHEMLNKAQIWFKKAVQAKPKSLGYKTQLGELYQRILDEDGELSAKWLQDAINIWKEIYQKAKLRTVRKRAMQQLFAFYHAQGTLYQLPPIYRARVDKSPRDFEALRWLGEYQLWSAKKQGRGSYLAAQQRFAQILQYKPGDLDSLLTLEQLASRRRQWRRARQLLLTAVKSHPQGRRGYYRRICTYSLKIGAYNDAIKYGRAALALNPEDASAHADLARIYKRAKQPKQAILAYREAIRLRPQSYGYHLALADLLRSNNENNKAADLYLHVVKNAKDGRLVFEAAIRAIEILHPLNQTRQLESRLQTLADAHPRELAYFRALAELYRRQGRMEEYRVAYLKAAATVDQKSQVYKRLAEVAQEQGDLQKAIIYYRKMLEESPNPTPHNQIQLSSFYLQVGDNTNASKILLALLNEHPNSLRVLRQVADLFYRYNMVPEATRAYELFLDQEFESSQLRLRLAELYQRQQQFEAAAGLLSELVWGETDRPVLKRRKKKQKPAGTRKKKKKKLPYYLRRRSYYSRYRTRYQRLYKRRHAMGTLINIYERMRMLDQWDQRVLLALSNPANAERNTMAQWLVQHYQQRRWISRLEKILHAMYKANPTSRIWIGHLARLYQGQARYADALNLYNKLERLNPLSRNSHTLQKLALVLGMKDHNRLEFLLQGFLSSHLAMSYHRVTSVLKLLKRHGQYKHMEHVLLWALKNGRAQYRERYLTDLTKVYLKLGKQKKARVLLWQAWKRKPSVSSRGSLRQLLNQRHALLQQLWPLMERKQRDWMLQQAERQLMDLLIEKPSHSVRLALVDLYTVIKMGKGDSMAQQYLPALWGMAKHSYYGPRMRAQIMQDLLHQGKYTLAIALIRKGLQSVKGGRARLFYLRRQFRITSKAGLLPPRKFSRFLERQLRALRSQVSLDEWKDAALQLSDQYLVWGNYQRAIWWIGVCGWSGGPKVRNDDRFLLRLARAYQRKGKDQLAKRNYTKVVASAWQKFNKDPGDAYQRFILDLFFRSLRTRYSSNPRVYRMYQRIYQLLKQQSRRPPAGQAPYSSYRYSRYRYILFRYNRFRTTMLKKYRTPIQQAAASISKLYRLHVEAEQKSKLFHRLRSAWRSSQKPKKKLERLYHLVAAYHIDWEESRTQSSLQAMLTLLRQLLPQHPLPKGKEIHHMLANLEAEAGRTRQAIRLLQTLYKLLPTKQNQERKEMLQRIAQIQGQAGLQRDQWKTQLKLSTQLQDGLADKWLANYYLEQGRLSDAIRFYRQFQRRGAPTTKSRRYASYTSPYGTRSRYRRYRSSRHTSTTAPPAPQQHLNVARFLMAGGHHLRAQYFLKRSLDSLRLQTKQDYRYRNTMHRAMLLLLHIGQLQNMVQEWAKQLPSRPQDLHLLSLLFKGYQILEQPEKVRDVTSKMLALRPYDKHLFTSLLNAFKDAQLYTQALKFLDDNYGKRSPKPDNYYLWQGRFYHLAGQTKQAFASWHLEFDECQKKTNNYNKFPCRYAVGNAMVEAGGIKEALKLYKKALRATGYYSYSFDWTVRIAANVLLEKKAFVEAIALVKAAMSRKRNQQQHLTYNDIANIELLLQGYKGLKRLDQREKLLRQLATGPFHDSSAAKQAARTLENAGWLLAAERSYWRALRKATYSTYRQTTYNELCGYWHRYGLHRLCDGEELKPAQRLEHQQRKQLAKHLERAGFPFLSLLELRKLRLYTPNEPEIWAKLFHLSLRVGRIKEARLWLEMLKHEQQPKSAQITAMERALAQPPTQPSTGDSQYSWTPVEIPAWCEDVKVNAGRIQSQKCQKSTTRCARRLLRTKGLLVTNDCKGRIIGIDAAKGTVLWVHQLPKLKAKVTIKGRGIHRKQKVFIYRFYDIQTLQATSDGVVVAANENWLENGHEWGSGMHMRLLLRKLNPTTGKMIWKQSYPGDYVRGKVVVHKGMMAISGRTYRVFDLATGQPLWHEAKGTRTHAWLFGDKTPLPHIALKDGFATVGSDQIVRSFDQKGQLRWKRRMPQPILGMTHGADQLFLISDNERLYALNASNGKPRWNRSLSGSVMRRAHQWLGMFSHDYTSRAVPLVVGQRLLLADNDGIIRAFSTKDGHPLWSQKIGDESPHGLQVDAQQKLLVHTGLSGTMSFVDPVNGKIVWRYFFPAQMRRSLRKESSISEINTPAFISDKHIWVGLYNRAGRFSIQAIARHPQQLESRTQRMYKLVKKLHQQREHKMALRALTQFVDQNNQRFRDVFVKLMKQRQLSHEQRLQWVYAHLASSDTLQEALQTLPKSLRRRNYTLAPLTIYTPRAEQRKAALTQLILMATSLNASHQRIASLNWQRLIHSRYQQWLRQINSPTARQFASMMLSHKKQEFQLLSAISLLVWGDQEGRKPLLQLLAKTLKNTHSRTKRLRLNSARLLFRWDSRYEWQGAVLAQDVPLFLPLLQDNNREIRLRVALFLGQLAAQQKAFRKHITPKVRQFLARSTSFPNRKLAVLSAITLAQLGERRGVLHLRRLFNQFSPSKQNGVGRLLQNQFDDYWGRQAVLGMYQGKYQINLSLPSFRIIYANRLFQYKRYNEAILHYQMMAKLPRQYVTNIHRAMAYYGTGLCFFALKRYKLARDKFKQALKEDPLFTTIYTDLGRTALAMRQYKSALAYLKANAKRHGLTPKITQYLAIAQLRLGQAKAAQDLYQRAMQQAKSNDKNQYHQVYAMALLKAGPSPTWPLALKLTNGLLAKRPSQPRLLFLKARILRKLKRNALARTTLNEAIVQDAPLSPYRPLYIKRYKQWFQRSPRIYTPKIQ